MLSEHIDRARARCAQALGSDDLAAIPARLASAGISPGECVREAGRISEPSATHQRLIAIRNAVTAADPDLPPGAFERFVLAETARRSIDRLGSTAVSDAVKRLWCDATARYTDPRLNISVSDYRFVAFSKMASLRRFPAGQFDWEPSGLPRSWLPRVRPMSTLVRLASLITTRWRAFSPTFFVHMTVTRAVPALLEREAEKAYYQMAKSMELQPHVKGLVASSWLHSPDTFRVSPHLAWLNRVFVENGAVVSTMGPASPDCGVLHRSPERKKAYEEGRFKPTLGLIVWPRDEMIAWASRHPELQA